VRLVSQVVADGGIGPWREATDLLFRTAWTTYGRQDRLSRTLIASLAVALADQPTRDRCWRAVESQPDRAWPAFWRHLSGRVLAPYRAEPLFLLAWSAWRLGEHRVARAAVIEALAEDPGHRAAALLLTLLQLGADSPSPPALASASAGAP
jgi:hypothetical protein